MEVPFSSHRESFWGPLLTRGCKGIWEVSPQLLFSPMRHPDFFEPAFDASSSAWEAGLQGAASPLPGLAGVSPALPSLLVRRRRRRTRSKKSFSEDTSEPRQGNTPAPRCSNFSFNVPG